MKGTKENSSAKADVLGIEFDALPDNVEAADAPKLMASRANMRHQVAVPDGYDYVPIEEHQPSEKPAREYPFTLDPFQSTAIACIERNESVLVSAHTSAGKTVVAEYAIAKSLQNHQRVVYTSPIKALSNQKYRDLLEVFGDCGLMTGDVTINPDASCMVMTTEILRSMLYRGSEIMREVAWVVFDEVHYMRDKERGVVWEETLILLPDNVKYVFLSATIPNALQFAEWICHIHKQPCHVVYTDFRPTPLQHYLFPEKGNGIYLVVDETSKFREDNFQKAIAVLQESSADTMSAIEPGRKKRSRNNGSSGELSDLRKIVKMIYDRQYHPVIVFSFSKREVEANALQLSKLVFNSDEERKTVDFIFQNAIGQLREEDQSLPQIQSILPLLRRGIGIHHSGLLPILKEVIELLFQEGLLKVLFATETFSIGLNMPARTVVFTSLQKFDGKSQRYVTPGEFIQMSGRAGRRGLDSRGIVILMLHEKMEPEVCKNMLTGDADRLNSAFYQSYNMILNLTRVEGIDPESLLQRSFYQFQGRARLPELEAELANLEQDEKSLVIENEDQIELYYELRRQVEMFQRDAIAVQMHPSHSLPFLQPGRLLKLKATIRTPEDDVQVVDYGWSALLNFRKVKSDESQLRKRKVAEKPSVEYFLDCLVNACPNSRQSMLKGVDDDHHVKYPMPHTSLDQLGQMTVATVPLSAVFDLSSIVLSMPKNLVEASQRNIVFKNIKTVVKKLGKVPSIDPVKQMKITDKAFVELLVKLEKLERQLDDIQASNPNVEEDLKVYEKKREFHQLVRQKKREIRDTEDLVQMNELRCRKRILRRLGYVTENDVIEVKGRIACEISAGDEIMLTELIFNNVFQEMGVDETVALVSIFCFDEKSQEPAKLTPELASALKKVQDLARYLARTFRECRLDINEEEYVQSFRGDQMHVVYAWSQGAPFSKICKMTDAFEGSIIRMMRRLEELLRQMSNAAKNIGNLDLEVKFAKGIQKIKRDIIFAASLYL